VPASKKIALQMIEEGLTEIFMKSGANVLATSCGPCLGTGQGIPADGYNVISTANRNFKGRMGNKEASIYLASPATVALSALRGEISDPRPEPTDDHFPYKTEQTGMVTIEEGENRYEDGVWNYADIHNLNTDQMFAGNLTYTISSVEPEKIVPHLFKGFDPSFAERVRKDDILIAGSNFGCGSSREHPAVGLSYIGVKAVICKSVNRIFYRSSVNQGLPIILLPEAVDAYKPGDSVVVDLENGQVTIAGKDFKFEPLPDKLMQIFNAKGLVNFIKG
jgi:3-isopropylmalate dehydratase small subunit